jgi:hypothetical protein
MSFWNSSSPEDRIIKWREFREEIRDLPKQEQLNRVAAFFANVPVGARSIDFYTPSTWPSPWEILYHKEYCASSISLLIFYTLEVLLKDSELSIVLIDDGRDRFLVPLVDKTHILNYILGEISTLHNYKDIRIVDDFSDDPIPHIS